MTTGAIAAVVFIALIVSLVLTVPIGFSLGIASLAYIFATDQLTLGFVARNMVTGTDSFPIMAIPFFVFAGELMGGGGISKRLLDVANVFFGRIRGGLAIVTVVVCMFFAAISGSGPATVAAVGGMVVPTMLEKGYDKKFVLALIAAAGSIGVIIPPSIPMVVYSVTVNSSVSSLFLAGFIPGILIGLVLIVYSYVYARKAGYKGDTEPFSIGRALREVWRGKWALLSPVIILGGIYGGIFTPTEAAAVSVIYSLIIGLFVHRELNFKDMLEVTKRSCETTATILVVIGCATGFSKVLTLGRIPTTVATLLTTMTDSKVLILLLINLLLLLVGCFMETVCAIMILAPILFPVVTALGVDPIHFGIIMVTNLAIGFITPPLGVNLFVASRVGETTLDVVIKGIVPFLVLMIATLMLITYVPAISMFLPNLLG
ncbi:C4-dicarboxylate ABC transporter permease [Anaerotignum lactatifermentans]|uniref:C4-dicarboxylate ABC transporter permease n=1 Tax=Anaerotignum lactatifermentans TaxID=160404 RepID=A0A1Y3UAB6_9FIRM|nr:TRAP transporter large permease [Anaerotignum lactatifermentans]OUN45684.1 C4-dicarboxylate ABC transporter permease [Anaerotignum lactatifermentans]